MVSCDERKTCCGLGQAGRMLSGATPQMKVRLRDWLTPKLPAFSTPKRTCMHKSSPCLAIATPKECRRTCLTQAKQAQIATLTNKATGKQQNCLVMLSTQKARSQQQMASGVKNECRMERQASSSIAATAYLVAHVQQGAQGQAEGEALVVTHKVAHIL